MSEASFASLNPALLARKGGAKPAMRPQLHTLPDAIPEGIDAEKLEDLGWNDMGAEDEAESSSPEISAETRSAHDAAVESAKVFHLNAGAKAGAVDAANEAELIESESPIQTKPSADSGKPKKQQALATMHELAGLTGADEDSDAADDDAPHAKAVSGAEATTGLSEVESTKAESNVEDEGEDTDEPALRRTASRSARRAAFTLRLDTNRHLKLRLAATMQGKSAQAVVTEALDDFLDQIDDLEALAARMKRH